MLSTNLAAGLDAWLRLLAFYDSGDLADAEPDTMRFRLHHLPARLAKYAADGYGSRSSPIWHHMSVSFTHRFGARELGEWFRLWIPGRAPVILEQRKGNGRTISAGTFQAFLTLNSGRNHEVCPRVRGHCSLRADDRHRLRYCFRRDRQRRHPGDVLRRAWRRQRLGSCRGMTCGYARGSRPVVSSGACGPTGLGTQESDRERRPTP